MPNVGAISFWSLEVFRSLQGEIQFFLKPPHITNLEPSTMHYPLKFNIAPENGWLEDEFPFGIPYFQGLC